MRIALVEQSPADARWIRVVLDEIEVDYSLLYYKTDVDAIRAAETWGDVAVAIIGLPLPLLTTSEVIQGISKSCDCPILVLSCDEEDRKDAGYARWFRLKPLTLEECKRVLSETPSTR